ncbi:MAG: conjugal transfer protein, partial [Neisseriaceae bacterium]|nr:conjugal transfer protein [Neisseriaceae bacterium]
DGEKGGYKHIGLSKKQFDEIKELNLDSRTFAVMQGNQWALAKLDLYGFREEIAVLSGTSANLVKMQEAIEESDDNPEHWLPIFWQKVRM